MIPIKKIIGAIFLISFIFIGSAFISISEEDKPTIFKHEDVLDCNACHASWTNSIVSGTQEDFVAMNHAIYVSFYDNYIAAYEEGTNDIDINKLTTFIDSI